MSVEETTYLKIAKLLDGVAVANNPPVGDVGVKLDDIRNNGGRIPEWVTISIRGTKASGTVSGVFRLWMEFPSGWCPAGNGTDADKGKLNDAVAIGEVVGGEVRHAQPVRVSEHASRMYLELISPTGTSPSFDAWVIASKK